MSSEYKKDITAVSKRTEKGTAFLEPGDQSIVVRSASFSYTVKKIEKLASGLHLVTNFIPVTESVRERMRDASLRILSNFLMIDSGTNELVIRHITAIENSIIELIMLLNIAHTAEYISFMNKDVLIREYTQLLEFIREHRGTLTAEDTAISDEFFNVPFPKESNQSSTRLGTTVSKGQDAHEGTGAISIKDTSKPITTQRQTSVRTDTNGSLTKRRDSRRSVILGLLKNQTKISIKDVSSIISDCSEKTLQRELLAMVDEGVLTKEGERRWSTYSLAT